jgi:enoyl-[acyl-carrier protein] reductase I
MLQGRRGIVIGVANDHSIGWGIARALSAEGATLAMTYRREGRLRHLQALAAQIGEALILRCDVQEDEQIEALVESLRQAYGTIDFLIHAPASAHTQDLNGPYLKTTRASFLSALDISAYSLTALAQAARPIMRPGASILTLSYHGARQVAPNYNVMGVAKAALEASVRYLASDLGPQQIRVNAISAGPIRTLSASGIAGFRSKQKRFATIAPLRRNVTIDEVGRTAAWLCSDMASAVTGEIIYVDAGIHHMAAAPALAEGGAER